MQNLFPPGDDNLTQPPRLAPGDTHRRASLQTILTRALGAFGLLPVLLLGLVAGVGDYLVRLNHAESTLTASVTSAGSDLDLFLSAHRSAVTQLAAEFARSPGDEDDLVQRLERTRRAFPGLLTMLATDAQGRVLAGSFDNRTGIDRPVWHGVDVSDRAYFRLPRDRGEPVVSEIFQGRGFGDDALSAVAAPVLDVDGRFLGIVQGSIRLADLGVAFGAAAHTQGTSLVILDPSGRVAYASEALGLEPLSTAPDGLSREVPVAMPLFMRPQIPALPAGDTLVLERVTALGWRVLALMPRQLLLQRTLLDLAVAMVGLLAMAALALVAGRRFARRFLRPLEDITVRMDRLSLAGHPERFRHRSGLLELQQLESAFLRLGQRLGDSYQQLQQEFAKESALRSALAEARVEAQRAEGELDAAREIQMAMLPSRSRLDRWPGLKLAALLEPMRAVGGDFFNVLQVDAGRLVFFIGDVSDKGVPAALFMARTMTLLEPWAGRGESPSDILHRVGRVLAQDNASGMFVTVLIGRLEIDSGILNLASAGHDPPLLRNRSGQVQRVEMETGPALGFEDNAHYPQVQLRMRPGDWLLMFTDGLSEAENSKGEAFGEGRIAGVFAGIGVAEPQDCVDALTAAVHVHRQASPADDLTLLCVQRPLIADSNRGEVRLLPSLGGHALPELLSDIETALVGRGLEEMPLHDVRLIVEEVVSNAVNHGCHSTFGVAVRVTFELTDDRLHLLFEDDGSAFDPLAQNLPDLDVPLAERGIGGLGVLLVRELAHDVTYERHGGLNRLALWLPRAQAQHDSGSFGSPASAGSRAPPHDQHNRMST
jgi:sigma-B regulation protein RsbU (phosphoserine phosphatase)